MHQTASQRIFISKKFPGQHAPGPPTNLVAFGHSGLLPPTINPRQNPGSPPISNQAKKARSFVTASNNVRPRVRVTPLYQFMEVSHTSRFANNLFATVLSRFANTLDQFLNLFRLITGLKVKEVNTCVLDFFVSWLKNKVYYSCAALVSFLKQNDLRRLRTGRSRNESQAHDRSPFKKRGVLLHSSITDNSIN